MKKVKVRKRRTVRLTKTLKKNNLGNGFLRTTYPDQTIDPDEFLNINLKAAPGRVVISAGWTISDFAEAYATDSYPSTNTNWIIILHNPTTLQRTVTPYLITKTL